MMIDINSKSKTLSSKQFQNTSNQTPKNFDLGERTYCFAKDIRNLIRQLRLSISNIEYGKQLIRSSGSVASNYIEASESLSRKDFIMRIKICRKEAKESQLWLKLIESLSDYQKEKERLIQEALELTKIFGSIVEKYK